MNWKCSQKKLLTTWLTLIVLAFSNVYIVSAAKSENKIEIKVILNGERLVFDQNPYIKNGRTLVPFRKIFESFGMKVQWNSSDRSVLASNEEDSILLMIDNVNAYVNNKRNILDVPPEITGSRTFVPLRFIGESIGAKVDWNNESKTVTIEYSADKLSIGQTGTYDDLKFSIDNVEADFDKGEFRVTGKINKRVKNLYVYLVGENDNYVYSRIMISEEGTDMYNFNSLNFSSTPIKSIKYIYLKIFSEDGDKKFGEYSFK